MDYDKWTDWHWDREDALHMIWKGVLYSFGISVIFSLLGVPIIEYGFPMCLIIGIVLPIITHNHVDFFNPVHLFWVVFLAAIPGFVGAILVEIAWKGHSFVEYMTTDIPWPIFNDMFPRWYQLSLDIFLIYIITFIMSWVVAGFKQ